MYTAHKLRDLLELEAKYGPLPGYTPAIDAVLNHLTQVHKQTVTIHVKYTLGGS